MSLHINSIGTASRVPFCPTAASRPVPPIDVGQDPVTPAVFQTTQANFMGQVQGNSGNVAGAPLHIAQGNSDPCVRRPPQYGGRGYPPSVPSYGTPNYGGWTPPMEQYGWTPPGVAYYRGTPFAQNAPPAAAQSLYPPVQAEPTYPLVTQRGGFGARIAPLAPGEEGSRSFVSHVPMRSCRVPLEDWPGNRPAYVAQAVLSNVLYGNPRQLNATTPNGEARPVMTPPPHPRDKLPNPQPQEQLQGSHLGPQGSVVPSMVELEECFAGDSEGLRPSGACETPFVLSGAFKPQPQERQQGSKLGGNGPVVPSLAELEDCFPLLVEDDSNDPRSNTAVDGEASPSVWGRKSGVDVLQQTPNTVSPSKQVVRAPVGKDPLEALLPEMMVNASVSRWFLARNDDEKIGQLMRQAQAEAMMRKETACDADSKDWQRFVHIVPGLEAILHREGLFQQYLFLTDGEGYGIGVIMQRQFRGAVFAEPALLRLVFNTQKTQIDSNGKLHPSVYHANFHLCFKDFSFRVGGVFSKVVQHAFPTWEWNQTRRVAEVLQALPQVSRTVRSPTSQGLVSIEELRPGHFTASEAPMLRVRCCEWCEGNGLFLLLPKNGMTRVDSSDAPSNTPVRGQSRGVCSSAADLPTARSTPPICELSAEEWPTLSSPPKGKRTANAPKP